MRHPFWNQFISLAGDCMTHFITPAGFGPDPVPHIAAPALAEYHGGPGVTLPPETNPADLEPLLGDLRLIVISFPRSADGRGFSLAGQLRNMGYQGHLRAHGHILVDQFRAALRVGFDDVAISDDQAARNPEHQWLKVSHHGGYQRQLFVTPPKDCKSDQRLFGSGFDN